MATVQLGSAIQRGLAASRPASGDATKAGQLYYSTDTKVLEQDDGSSWAVVATNLALGTTGTTAAAGNDSRLSDARTPTTHHTSHNTGGGDAIAPADIGAAAASHTHTASAIASGTIATARLGSGTADGTTYLRGDQTWATPSGGSGGHTIQDDGTPLTARAALNFIPGASGVTVTDNSGDDSTDIDFSALIGGASDAADVTYDPTASGLTATDVQAAIDEIVAGGGGGGGLPAVAPGDIFYVTGVAAEDIALGQTVATSVHSGSDDGSKLVDGNTATYWSTVPSAAPQNASFYAGGEVETDSFAILQYSATDYYATSIKMQGSHDNTNWVDIPGSAVSPALSGSLQTFNFTAPVTYSYYKLIVLADGGTPSVGTGLKQWSVYSTAALSVVRLPIDPTPGKVLTTTTVGSDVLPRWA